MFKRLQGALFLSFIGLVVTSLLIASLFQSRLISILVAGLIAALLSFLFAYAFARPIAELSEIARRIAAGQIPQTILHKSRFEVGELEEALEQMSNRLAKTFQKLETERNRSAAILEGMAEGVLATDAEGKLILANPAITEIFGLSQGNLANRTVREALRNNEIADLCQQALERGEKIEREITIITPVQRTFAAAAAPLRVGKDERLSGAVLVLHDITELKRLESYRSEFVANVSHELKTPLTAIRNYTEALLDGALTDPQRNLEFLRKLDKHALNLSSLIDDLLEVSRLENKRELGAFLPVDLKKVIGRAVETVEGKIKKKKIALRLKCEGEEQRVMGIEEHLYRALLNLIDNAVNYTNDGGEIEISCRRQAGEVILAVRDTGIGIPAVHLPRLFERFYRVDQARSRDLGGTGLGLAIVKHVVQLHQGSVAVESVEGEGSTFTIKLPAA